MEKRLLAKSLADGEGRMLMARVWRSVHFLGKA